MAKIGYARVSSVGQSLKVQLKKLAQIKCDKVYREKRSGKSEARPQLQACLDYVRKGDTLVVSRLDRLARSTLHLCKIAETLQSKGVALHVIDQNINTADATGRLLFNMLGAIGQFENEIRAERQADGIAEAKQRGVKSGRPSIVTEEIVTKLRQRRAQGVKIKTLMADYGLSKTSVYRYLADAWVTYLREGDTLVVSRLDRLARSTLQLCQIAEKLQEKGVALRVTDQAIDTGDATGRLLFNMLGAIAQFETEIRAERQADGIKKAQERGVKFGRRPALTDEQVVELRTRREQGVLVKDLMQEFGVSKSTAYSYLADS